MNPHASAPSLNLPLKKLDEVVAGRAVSPAAIGAADADRHSAEIPDRGAVHGIHERGGGRELKIPADRLFQ